MSDTEPANGGEYPSRTGNLYPSGEGPRCLIGGCDNEAQWWADVMHEYRTTCTDHSHKEYIEQEAINDD
jgi:hypothetical protein